MTPRQKAKQRRAFNAAANRLHALEVYTDSVKTFTDEERFVAAYRAANTATRHELVRVNRALAARIVAQGELNR